MTLDIDCFDAFCGAGGSSTGIEAAGVHVKHAVNHWAKAIETHSLNHPNTDHDIMDLQGAHPKLFPKTTICWMSPECTNHSKAKGEVRKNLGQMSMFSDDDRIDPEEERSRATMREVVEFSAYHKYEIVVVENVVEIRYWQYYDEWLQAMINLGYDYKLLYLNAMFFGVPQSRDRIYCVFWKKGNKAPDLEFNPWAYCIDHGVVGAQQAWKKNRVAGKYGHHGQYVYVCPQCSRPLEPFTLPASDIIDWSLPSERIGDRKKPLKPKTMMRIKEGLKRFAQPVIMDTAYPGEDGKIRSSDDPMFSITTQQTLAMADPFLLSYMNQALNADSVFAPLRTVATGFTPRMVVPPSFLMHYYSRDDAVSDIHDPVKTVTPENRFGLVISTNDWDNRSISTEKPIGTLTTQDGKWGLLSFISELRNHSVGRSFEDPLSAITTMGSHHALITVPSFMAILKGSWSKDGERTMPQRSWDDVLTTLVQASQHAVITPPQSFIMAQYGKNSIFRETDEPMPGITTISRHSLIITDEMVDQCGFRMLEPNELKLAMSFPESYTILGTKRQQTKQIGDAVCCNVAQAIIERCVASLN